MRIWIYRPDIEAFGRRMNGHFIYDGRGEAFDDVCEKRKLMFYGCVGLLQRQRRR